MLYNFSMSEKYDAKLDENTFVSMFFMGSSLLLSKKGDVVTLPVALKNQYPFVYDHYKQMGFTVSDNIQWIEDDFIISPDNQQQSTLYLSKDSGENDDDYLDSLILKLNDKIAFMELARHYSFTVPYSKVYSDINNIDVGAVSYPLIMKYSYAFAGLGIKIVNSSQELDEACNFFENKDVLVQEYIPHEALICTICQITDANQVSIINSFSITQPEATGLIDSTSNLSKNQIYHLPDEVAESIINLLMDLAKEGLRGILMFDFISHNDKHYLIECNPRHGGASFPALFCREHQIHEWEYVTFYVKKRHLNEFDLHPWWYSQSKQEGIIVVGWQTTLGLLRIVIVGNQAARIKIYHEICQQLKGNAVDYMNFTV